jgi:solute:Na+ symporter, SSS family
MDPIILLLIIFAYFLILLLVSYFTGKKNLKHTFYHGDRKSPWFVVTFGMIGTTISGVTFISVPGEVGNSAFHYFQFVMGNMVGYILIATLLLPYYYRKNVISIYSVLESKMGREGYLTTSGFFILSKVIGASFRLFLAALVLYMAISKPLGISFGATTLLCLLVIWLYTFKSGIKTVVWSDTIQTVIFITAVVITIIFITHQLNLSASKITTLLADRPETKIFEFNWRSPQNFFKQFVSGIFMTIALNGFDQDIVQKNLTCRSSTKARKNMLWFTFWFGVTVFLFLTLGALLYYFAKVKGILLPGKSDQLYPLIALNYLGSFAAVLFILGISAAAFSSADSATTALTTTFCVDFLKLDQKTQLVPILRETRNNHTRNLVHLGFSLLIFTVIMLFYKLNNESVVTAIFKAAGYTYGPILGVYLFSFFIPRIPKRISILPICLASPLLTFLITELVRHIWKGYHFGFELIVLNSLLTLILLIVFSKKKNVSMG